MLPEIVDTQPFRCVSTVSRTHVVRMFLNVKISRALLFALAGNQTSLLRTQGVTEGEDISKSANLTLL